MPEGPAAHESATSTDRVGVVGAGLIGGSITRAYLGAGVDVEVVDLDVGAIKRAAAAGATPTSLADLASAVDVAFLCPPPRTVAPVWADLVQAAGDRPAGPRLVALDVASVKRPVVDGLAEAGTPWASDDAVFILSHPMAGREHIGWDASDPRLFDGATWVLLPPAEATGEELARAIQAVQALGATVCFMEVGFHDRFAAVTSHVAHAFAFTFQRMVDELDPTGWRRFSGNSLRDLLRVSVSDADLWTEILEGSAHELQPILAELGRRLSRFDPARDVPAVPPTPPHPDATDAEGRPTQVGLPWDTPIGEHLGSLLATGEAGLHLADRGRRPGSGELLLTFGAPVASDPRGGT